MKNYFDKYVFIAPGSDYGYAMWADLATCENCEFLDYPISFKHKMVKILHHIHFSFWINKRWRIPFQKAWSGTYSLNQLDFEEDKKYCIILPDVSACRMDVLYLERLQKRKNIDLVLVNVNVIQKKESLILERMKYFSKIFSFDIKDCERYGCVYHPTIYSKQLINCDFNNKSDAFFVGTYTPERYKKIVLLYKLINKKGGRADFHVIGVPRGVKRVEGINYNKVLPYSEVVNRVYNTKCIVEIMNKGQMGLTLRAMEAVCYNKKLFTDNPTVTELSYYQTGFIQYASQIDKADISFILQNDNVDYNYSGEFSPIRLLEHIEQIYGEGKK